MITELIETQDHKTRSYGKRKPWNTIVFVLSRWYYRRVCQTRFSKIKKIPFPSTAVYHKKNTENISLTEQFEHLQSYSTLIWYDFWWKVSRPNIAKVSGVPKIQLLIKKNYGRKQLLLLYAANTTIEACPEWVSAFNMLWPHKPYSGVMRTPPPHTNTTVGSARPELVTKSLPCKI